jgi:hypothetical protein
MHEQCEKAHGRVDVRRIQVAAAAGRGLEFPGVSQIFRIERESWRGRPRKQLSEVAFGITSLPAERASPEQLLGLVRGHWIVEAGHHVRDVGFGEDQSRIRGRAGSATFAALRNAAIGLARLAGAESVAAALRTCAWAPQLALRAVGVALN